ncbi:MAG: hypothetical protein K0U98_12825 [Deltaproteobacteria bacterium]|nr:hypothetical protein [Deltaproteobacteria bacterium]
MKPLVLHSYSRRAFAAVVSCWSLLFLSNDPVLGQCAFSAAKTPAAGAPIQLWGDLEPWDTGALPNARDNSDWNQIGSFETHPYAISMDVEQNWVFLAQNRRFQIWNANTLPGSFNVPNFDISLTSMANSGLVYTDSGHSFFVIQDIDAPPNNSNVVAMVGVDGMGMGVYNTTNKANPSLIYQDHGGGRYARQVYTTTIGGRHYAFVAGSQDTALPGGAFVYDLSAALTLTSTPCVEARPSGSSLCPGVYQGKIGSRTNVRYIDGAGDFVVLSSTFSPDGFEIWDVSTPSAPTRVMNALTSDPVYGVAMWQDGSSYYLAIRTTSEARVYNVSCITGGTCNLGSPAWSQSNTVSGSERTVTFSRSNSTPFVYYGTSQECLSGNQNEWLLDVSNPSSPVDISPQGTVVIGGQAVSYWGWYYWNNGVHGFNRTAPRMGKFSGEYFFRAGYSIFDVHKRTGGSPPVASFSWAPLEIYPGTSIQFTDGSTGSPDGWDWDFLPDGVPSNSSQQNPNGVSFPSPGTKTINLEASNSAGSDMTSRSLQVLPAAPNIGNVAAVPNPALICQPVTFTAQGVTGQPPLGFSWVVRDNQGASVATGSTNPFTWSTSPGDLAGSPYSAEVTVMNSTDSDMSTSPPVSLSSLPPLPQSETFTPIITSEDPPTSGTVQFMVSVGGATEWNWNFGDNPGGGPDGDGYEGWTSDPILGPSPTNVFDTAGIYSVRVKVRNCLESASESSALEVEILSVVPLVADFSAVLFCQAGTCFADAGDPITFNDDSLGEPEFWDYDWDGDGSFEDAGNTSPVASHAYDDPGLFRPVLRVRKGASQNTFEHEFVINVGNVDPDPSISVSGPGSVVIDSLATFNATASDCAPVSTGWTWTTDGGSGASTGPSIDLSWSTPGTKTVTASNSACGSAQGSSMITVIDATAIFVDGFEAGDTSAWTLTVTP